MTCYDVAIVNKPVRSHQVLRSTITFSMLCDLFCSKKFKCKENYGKRSCGSIASRPRNSSHLILVDSLVNQTRRRKSARANVNETKTLNMRNKIFDKRTFFSFSLSFVSDPSANVLVSPTKLSDLAPIHIARLFHSNNYCCWGFNLSRGMKLDTCLDLKHILKLKKKKNRRFHRKMKI